MAQSSSNEINALAGGDTWSGRTRSNFRSWFTILAASELISSALGEVQYEEILPIITKISSILLGHQQREVKAKDYPVILTYLVLLNS